MDIRLTDVTLTGNIAGGDGGAMYNQGHFDPILERVTFTGNQASDFGGAMYNWNGGGAGEPFAYAELNHVSFEGNSATYGGAMSNLGSGGWTSPEMHNTSFTNNTASYGGALYNAAAQNRCHPTLVNVIFSNNSATSYGGAVYNSASNGGGCSPTFTNTSFSGNSAGSLGGALYNLADPTGECTPVLSNSILWGNSATSLGPEIYNVPGGTPGALVSMSYSLIEGMSSGGSVLDGTLPANNPLFVDVPNNNLRLQSGSPAINSGNNGANGLIAVTTDLDGNPRFVGVVDLGAYELGAGAPGDQAPQLRVVSLSGGILRLAADDIPAGQTFHLETSESLQGFVPADPSFEFTSLTVQPFEISVDPIATPRQFYRSANGPSPE